MIGIYKITNLENGRCYIGQSINIEHRLKEHEKCEGDSYIHRTIKKYGLKNFSFEVVEECKPEQLDEKEKYWIAYYRSFGEGYNLTPGGQGFQNSCAVDCFNFNGDRVATYQSITEAQFATGAAKISDCINGKRKTSGGFQWKYHDPRNDFIDVYRRTANNSQPISQYSLDGQWLNDFCSISEATLNIFHTDNGSMRRRIKKACENNIGEAEGYRWKYHKKSAVAAMADLLD